ncbi:MAG: YqaE/Pmp3 family membrane protein [Bacteroidota bacterium]
MSNVSTNQLILILIAIFIPPLAVFLNKGLEKEFWITLILTFFFFVPGMLYAIYVILN